MWPRENDANSSQSSKNIRRPSKDDRSQEKLECAISLIPKAPWKHEEVVELCYLAALRFGFPTAYFSLISSIPSLGPFDEKTGQLKVNSAVDVYTPVVRHCVQSESTVTRALEKLLRRLAYFTQDSKVISTDPVTTSVLTLSIVSDKTTPIPDTPVDPIAYKQCVRRAETHADGLAVAAVSGITVKIDETVKSAPRDGKSAINRHITLQMTTNFPAISWYFLYAEAIRQIEPTVFAVCNEMLGKRAGNTLSKISMSPPKEKHKISKLLRLIFGGGVTTRVGTSPKADNPHEFFCSVESKVPQEDAKRAILLHYMTGTSYYEALVKMRYFLTSYYVKHVGAHNAVASNNLYISEQNSIPEATLRELLPAAENVEISNSAEMPHIKFLRHCLRQTGEVAVSPKEDAALRSSMLGGTDGCPLQAVFLTPAVKESTQASLRASVWIGGDYETTISSCIPSYLKRFYPRVLWKYNMMWALHRASLKKPKKKSLQTTASALCQMANTLAPVVLRADDLEGTSHEGLSTFSIQFADEATNGKDKVRYDPKDVLRGDSHIEGSQPNAPPALRAFFDLHWESSRSKDAKTIADWAAANIRPTNCARSIHILVSRLIKVMLSADASIKTFIHRKTENIPTNNATIEHYYRYAPQSAQNGLFSGFAWVEIRTDGTPSSDTVLTVRSALQSFLGLEQPTNPSFLSLVGAVHNAHSHEQCATQLDAAILRNMFPEVYSWLKQMTQANGTHYRSLPLSFEPTLSFLPDSKEQSRLALLRRSVAEYFGCDRLREVCVRRGCFFDIDLLHPTTGEATGLSILAAPSPLGGLMRLYRETLFNDTHYERFQTFRLAFIARDAVLTKGNTHRAPHSLVQFVSAQLRRQVGFSLYLSREHRSDGTTELKAFGVNHAGQSVELLSAPHLPEKNPKLVLGTVLLTVCYLYMPNAMRTATQLAPPGTMPIRCDYTSNALKYAAFVSDKYKFSESVLPSPLHPCSIDRLLGSVQASIDGTTFSPIALRCVSDQSAADGNVFTAKIHLRDNADIVIASHSSGSPLRSSLRCCEALLADMGEGTWKVSAAHRDITLKCTKPFYRDDFVIEPPSVTPGFLSIMRLLRHCCMAYFGLELQVTRRDSAGCELTINAHGMDRQWLTLCAHREKTILFAQVLLEAVTLHFPAVMASINRSKIDLAFPGKAKPSSTPDAQPKETFGAHIRTSFALPQTNAKCTIQLMRAAFTETYKYAPKEVVRILSDKEKAICVEILDENNAVVEHHRSRSLPFSLMECYGLNFQRHLVAMKAFELLEKTHPYSPPSVVELADPHSEAVYNLLVYVVRYELGLETICTVELNKSTEDRPVRVVISAVSPKHARAVHLGEELLLSVGMDCDECVARRRAALVALRVHFPIYFRKHGLAVAQRRPDGKKSLEDHSPSKAK